MVHHHHQYSKNDMENQKEDDQTVPDATIPSDSDAANETSQDEENNTTNSSEEQTAPIAEQINYNGNSADNANTADNPSSMDNDNDANANADGDDHKNCNPDGLPDELKNQFLVDAIGDTLYSKRFVLQTLLDLNKVENTLSEEFEKDLCTLWDMTIEKDVIKLLLEHNVIEIFSTLIQMSEDQRLVEILLGIIGNMCSLSDTREALCGQPSIMIPILELISCTDSLILVQLMRLMRACLVFDNSGDEIIWFQHFRCADQFVDRFAFLLSNSMSTTLLLNAYEALHVIFAKFSVLELGNVDDPNCFRDVFVKPVLLSSVLEAFKQMLPTMPRLPATQQADTIQSSTTPANNQIIIDDDITAPTQRTQRIMSLFLDINVVFSQYEHVSLECYTPFIPQLMECLTKCLQPLCFAPFLLPLTPHEQVVVESVNELIQTLGDPFDTRVFRQMILIWSLIEKHIEDLSKRQDECGWGDDSDEEISNVDVNITILEYITRTGQKATQEQIETSIRPIGQETIVSLYKALSRGSGEDDIRECLGKFQEAVQTIWNVELSMEESAFDDDEDENEEDDNDNSKQDSSKEEVIEK